MSDAGSPAASGGYTLLEVVLAISIAMSLVYAIHLAAGMHYAQLQTGREIAEQAQLVRSLAQQLRRDVGATFTQWQPASLLEESMESGMVTTGTILEEDDIPAGGVTGDESSLSLIIRTVPGDLIQSEALLQEQPPADLRMVHYYLVTDPTEETAGEMGLVREEVPRAPDDNLLYDPAESSRIEVLAPEVRSLALQYFDGSEWYPTWDSTSESAPLAIEITLGILDPRFADQDANQGTQTLREYRIVAAPIPMNSSATSDSGASSSEMEEDAPATQDGANTTNGTQDAGNSEN